jgi:Rrf2 family protein
VRVLPARCLLAIAAVTDVALHARTTPVAAKALAARHGLMPRHLETLLQDLVHADILKAFRGPRGGYELARERRRITVGEIVRAASKPNGAAKPKPRPKLVTQVIEPALAGAGALLLDELDRITVDTLCRRAEAQAEATPGGIDFTI